MSESDYFVPHGMLLKPGENCDNAALFLVTNCYLKLLLHRLFYEDEKRFKDAELECSAHRQFLIDKQIFVVGLYHRAKGRDRDTNSFDEYLAWAAGAVLFEINRQIAIDIFEYGKRTGFIYNNVEPGKFEVWASRQPSEIAFYAICAGYRPDFYGLLWMCAGLLITAFQGPKKTSEHLLTWLRVQAIEQAGLDPVYRRFYNPCKWIWEIGVKLRFGSMAKVFEIYYINDSHPNVTLAKELYSRPAQ